MPALGPDLSYADPDIQDGGTASALFAALYTESGYEVIRTTRAALLEYCKMDTLGMVRVVEVVRGKN